MTFHLEQFNLDSFNWDKSFKEIDDLINELINLDYSKLSYDEIHTNFFRRFDFVPAYTAKIDLRILKNLALYRARPCSDVSKEASKVSDSFGGPPKDLDIGFGRANWFKRNVFYGGDSFQTALMESKRINVGEEFYVAKWRFNINKLPDKPLDVRVFFADKLPKENMWHLFASGFGRTIEKQSQRHGKRYGKKLEYYSKRICDLFLSEDTAIYPLTAYLADYGLYNIYNNSRELYFPLLLYPSVVNNHKSCNFAIHPDFVKEYMYLDTVVKADVKSIDSDIPEIAIEKVSRVSETGKVSWYTYEFDIKKSEPVMAHIGCKTSGRIFWPDEFKDITIECDGKKMSAVVKIHQILQTYLIEMINNFKIDDLNFNDFLVLSTSFNLSNCRLFHNETVYDAIIMRITAKIPVVFIPD